MHTELDLFNELREKCKEASKLKKTKTDLLEALEAIAHDTADFEHGDDNLQRFVRGLNSYAERAIAKANGN